MRHHLFPVLYIALSFSLHATGVQDSSVLEDINSDNIYDYSEKGDSLYSLEANLSSGLITNEMDAAFSADEKTSGPGFSGLDSLYMFGGVDNITGITNDGASPVFFMGAYFPGNTPVSFYAKAYHKGVGKYPYEVSSDNNLTVTDYDILYYRIIDDEFQFLISHGKVTTGLYYNLYLRDNRNYYENYTIRSSDPALNNRVSKKNGSLISHSFLIPLFVSGTRVQHYFEFGFTYAFLNSSVRNDLEGTDFTDVSFTYIPELKYRIHLPAFRKYNEKNQLNLTFSAMPALVHYIQKGSLAGVSQPETDNVLYNLDASLQIEQALYIELSDSVKLGFKPSLSGYFSARPVSPQEWNSETSFGASFECPSVLEFKPEKWFVGFSIGVIPKIGYGFEKSYDDSDNVTMTYSSNPFSSIVHSYGLFFPLPGGYRLDVSVGYNGLWNFDDLRMQLILPLTSRRTS